MIHATTPAPIERPARAARLSASPAFSPSCTTAARHGAFAQRLAGLALALGLAACGGKDAPATEPQGPAAVGVVTLQTRAQQLDATLPGRTRRIFARSLPSLIQIAPPSAIASISAGWLRRICGSSAS